jgi:CRP/FNR family transcriptional regulator
MNTAAIRSVRAPIDGRAADHDRGMTARQIDVLQLLDMLPRDANERFSPRSGAALAAGASLATLVCGRTMRRRIRRGESVFSAGDPFGHLYSVRCGFFKTKLFDSDGREQVTGFFMGGDLLGMGGFGCDRYVDSASALEDSEVYAIPSSLIEEVGRRIPSVQRRLHAALADEIARSHGVMMMLGSMRANERLAAFLINLSGRFACRGYSGIDFVLRMTRSEIGSFLGLEIETVSRTLSGFQRAGLIRIEQKRVSLLDMPGLKHVYSSRET